MFVKVRAIKTEEDYEASVSRMNELVQRNEFDMTEEEKDELLVISNLVWIYEEEHYPIDPPDDPVDTLKFWMDQNNLKQVDLIPFIGGKSQVSEILAGKRKLTVNMIRMLHKGLGIPVESLVGKGEK